MTNKWKSDFVYSQEWKSFYFEEKRKKNGFVRLENFFDTIYSLPFFDFSCEIEDFEFKILKVMDMFIEHGIEIDILNFFEFLKLEI